MNARFAKIGLFLLFASNAALAHHSGAMFDRTKLTTLNGTIKEYLWSNPHVWMVLQVLKDDGTSEAWSIEGGSTGRMSSFGMGPSAMAVGTKLKVVIHPIRDGRLAGSFVSVTLPNGKVLATEEPSRPDSKPVD